MSSQGLFGARLWARLGIAAAVVVGVLVVRGLLVESALGPQLSADVASAPYPSALDARAVVEAAKSRAATSGKMLMVTFGANWCPDCLTLSANLHDPETRAYADAHFEMLSIDVGDAEKSARVERELGIRVDVIPLAVFYTADGELIGDTLAGELRPSRHYSSREIRDFLREVVDYGRIVSPDQRQ